MRRTILLLTIMVSMVLVVLAVGLTVEGRQAEAQVSTLADEQLDDDIFYPEDNQNWAQPSMTFSDVNCDPGGTSTFKVSSTGTAYGPYPGTFQEDVTVKIGPQTIDVPNSPYPVKKGALTELTSNFKIVSGDTVITGTRQLVTPDDPNYDPSDPSTGICQTWDPPLNTDVLENTTAYYDITGWSNYHATITNNATGTSFTDSGLGLIGLASAQQQYDTRTFLSGGYNGQFAMSYTPQVPDPVNSVSKTVGSSGGLVSTGDFGPIQATAADPINTSIYVPNTSTGGTVKIDETFLDTNLLPTNDFTFLGQQVNIEAPQATFDNPLKLVFVIDSSVLQQYGANESNLQLFRDGVRIENCTDPNSGIASPDPCIRWMSTYNDGDLEVSILSSHASKWNLGMAKPGTPLYSFKGFYAPVDNKPTLNVVKAGSAVPVKFSLGGDEGIGIFAENYPRSAAFTSDVNAPSDPIEQTVTANSSGLSYNANTGQYTYTWKTDKAWAGHNRQLIMRLKDGTEHVAYFKFTK